VHGDVFRPPPKLSLFCALVGTGLQLASMIFGLILFACATTLYMGRGTIIVAKQRQGPIGPVRVRFDESTAQFADEEPGQWANGGA
jgi:replicative DNA helicase